MVIISLGLFEILKKKKRKKKKERKKEKRIKQLKVIEAHDLKGKGSGGKSSPFCTIEIGDSVYESDIVENSLNPVWNSHIRMYALSLFFLSFFFFFFNFL